MGIDVNLYAVGEISDERLAEANAFVKARCTSGIIWDYRTNEEPRALERASTLGYAYDEPRIEFLTGARYYGPGYERGPWPEIYGAIMATRAALPECRVFYGGDTGEDCEEATDERLAEIWQHWAGPHGDEYRESWRRWEAERTP